MVVNESAKNKVELIYRHVRLASKAVCNGNDTWTLDGVTVRMGDEGYANQVFNSEVNAIACESLKFDSDLKRFVPGAAFFKGDESGLDAIMLQLGLDA